MYQEDEEDEIRIIVRRDDSPEQVKKITEYL